MSFFLTLFVLFVALAISWRFLGSYMAGVYQGNVKFLYRFEKIIYTILDIDPNSEQTWKGYGLSVIVFSGISLIFTYAILRFQNLLPLNPVHFGSVSPALAFNTSVSFVTNTNWQNYAGETTMSYLSQMIGLTVQQFVSASVGLAISITLIRGLARKKSSYIGNFWVDLIRGILYILLPIAFIGGIIFVAQGALQTLSGPMTVHDVLNNTTQVIPRGPVGFMESIKQLGTNGGGFFNANGSDPFENPTPLTLILSVFLLLVIPFSLTYTFGKMVGSIKQGIAILMAMIIIFGISLGIGVYAEMQPNPAVAATHLVYQSSGNMVGKETRFGALDTALYNIASTQTSTGSISGANDSFTPLGGLILLSGMMLGEVSPGGVGSGLYKILLFALIAVFIGGLMIGRTPEYLGKKIQAKEVKLAALGVLIMPITVLVLTALAVSVKAGVGEISNLGPHGFSEILYSYTSQANNNGSAFAGLNGNTAFYNITGAIAMLLGRFGVIIPVLALSGSLSTKQIVPTTLGTFKTDNSTFTFLVVAVIVIVGGLTFFPSLSLGPIIEMFFHRKFF